MNQLRSVEEIGTNLKVLLRMDIDLPIEANTILDDIRLRKSIPTIRLLLERNNKVVIMGHRGRPSGRDPEMSLKLIYAELMGLLEINGQDTIGSVFVEDIEDGRLTEEALNNNQLVFLENLRFWSGEENNDDEYLKELIGRCDVFVNDAFAVAHRKHASIMLHQKMETYYGLAFVEEAENLAKILRDPQRPLTIILGGAKEDKLGYLQQLGVVADRILIGGKLPKFTKEETVINSEKIIVGGLTEDGLDINNETIEKFRGIISNSKTVIWIGAMGFWEDENHRRGTEEIANAVANSMAYTVIAGGDTGASINSLGLKDKISFIASGGGVMLEFISNGSLPAWNLKETIKNE